MARELHFPGSCLPYHCSLKFNIPLELVVSTFDVKTEGTVVGRVDGKKMESPVCLKAFRNWSFEEKSFEENPQELGIQLLRIRSETKSGKIVSF